MQLFADNLHQVGHRKHWCLFLRCSTLQCLQGELLHWLKHARSKIKLCSESHLLGRQCRHIKEEHLLLRTSHIALKYYGKWLISCNGFNSFISYQEYLKELFFLNEMMLWVVSTALWCFTYLLWDQCVGVNLGVMHRKLQTQMQVRWDSQPTQRPTTQNWIQFPVSCCCDDGGTELKTHKSMLVVFWQHYIHY